MSATLAPNPWPMAPRAAGAFGREIVLTGRPGAPRALQWLLERDNSFTLRQLLHGHGLVCALVLAAAVFFPRHPLVPAGTGLALLASGLALAVVARHARDRETLTLVGRSLLVEQRYGRRVARTDFAADWATVEPAAGQGSLVQIRGRGHMVRVGRFLRPEARAAFAQELRRALRRGPVLPENDSN